MAGESAGYNPASLCGSPFGAGMTAGSEGRAHAWIAPAGLRRCEGGHQLARPAGLAMGVVRCGTHEHLVCVLHDVL